MSREYAEEKMKQALKECGGNLTLARKQVLIWAHDDAALLKAIVSPHLDGIIAYQVERVASGRAEIEKRQPEIAQKTSSEENFGMDLLRAVAADEATVFGQDDVITPKRKGASKQHIDAIHKMAAASRNSKKTDKK